MNVKDKSEIPTGPYCYKISSVVTGDDGMPVIKTRPCPYYGYQKIAGVPVLWCYYLDEGGIPDNLTECQAERLVKHFGSESEMYNNLPLSLLWDQVKHCGIKNNEGE